jgi:patatin-like phospholipase/acyl hydrolase
MTTRTRKTTSPKQAERPIRILSIDGGGMRGIIPARALVELERLTGRRIGDMFDVIAGTSTGGIIALAVAKPGEDGTPAFTAEEILDTYVNLGPAVFPRINFRPVTREHIREIRPEVSQRVGAVTQPRRYGNARFRSVGLELLLSKYFGDVKLSQAMADVICPTYDWKAGRAFLFRSRQARDGTGPDPSMTMVARATSAAPTYFAPLRLRAQDRELVLIDGGFVANNPASIAYYEALRAARNEGRESLDVQMVSLGTGRPPEEIPTYQELWSRNWLRLGMGMLGVMFDGTSEIVDATLEELIGPTRPVGRYWRLNADVRGATLDLDDARPRQVRALLKVADQMVEREASTLAEISEVLTTP